MKLGWGWAGVTDRDKLQPLLNQLLRGYRLQERHRFYLHDLFACLEHVFDVRKGCFIAGLAQKS